MEQVPGKLLPTSQRSESAENTGFQAFYEYKKFLEIFKSIKFSPKEKISISLGISTEEYISDMKLECWQDKIKYFRLKKGLSADWVASQLGMKDGTSYMKKYEYSGVRYYTSVENYKAVCSVLGIKYEDIADEYMLFIDSDYHLKIEKAIKLSGLSPIEFAEKYDVEYTTLRHSIKRMHKLSIASFEKFSAIFNEYGLS